MEQACANGDLAAVKECFKAISSNHKPMFSFICRRKILPGCPCADVIERSLCISVQNGQLSPFQFLLAKGASITRPVITAVCCSNRPEFCEALCRRGWNVNKYECGPSPLFEARQSPLCTQWLLEHSANPNMAPFESGKNNLLVSAVLESTPEVVRLLVKHGIHIRGSMALHVAASLSERVDGNTWTRYSDPSRLEMMRILIDAGANVNEMEPDPKGVTGSGDRRRNMFNGMPLHYAVYNGSVEAVEFLLARGADPMAPSWSGATPLHIASRSGGRQDIIDVLKRYIKRINDRYLLNIYPGPPLEY